LPADLRDQIHEELRAAGLLRHVNAAGRGRDPVPERVAIVRRREALLASIRGSRRPLTSEGLAVLRGAAAIYVILVGLTGWLIAAH
jgi:hypothetical protein